jgi:hypothetical protein
MTDILDDVSLYIDRLTCEDCDNAYTFVRDYPDRTSTGCAKEHICDRFSLSGANSVYKSGLMCGKLWRSDKAPERDKAIREYIRAHGTLELTGDGGRVFYESCSRC